MTKESPRCVSLQQFSNPLHLVIAFTIYCFFAPESLYNSRWTPDVSFRDYKKLHLYLSYHIFRSDQVKLARVLQVCLRVFGRETSSPKLSSFNVLGCLRMEYSQKFYI